MRMGVLRSSSSPAPDRVEGSLCVPICGRDKDTEMIHGMVPCWGTTGTRSGPDSHKSNVGHARHFMPNMADFQNNSALKVRAMNACRYFVATNVRVSISPHASNCSTYAPLCNGGSSKLVTLPEPFE